MIVKTYIINDDCIFNERKYELRNVSNSLVIRMTAMRARCLSFIIEHAQEEVIGRQELTTALWGSRGNYVNDANLTQLLYGRCEQVPDMSSSYSSGAHPRGTS